MRIFRRVFYFLMVLAVSLTFQQSGRAESQGDHSGPEKAATSSVDKAKSSSKTKSSSKPGQSKPLPVRVITRQEALIEGLKDINIERPALEELVKFTEENPNLDPKRFSQVVDQIVEEQPLVVTEEQAEGLKQLYEKELGPVEGSELGTEFNLAAQRVLTEQDKVAQAKPKEESEPSEQRDDSVIPKIRRSEGGIDSGLAKQFEGAFGEKAKESAIEEKLQGELNKRLAKADALLNKAAQVNQPLRRDGAVGKEGGGLLDAIRSAIKDIEGDKDDKKDSGAPPESLGDALKDALAKNTPPPPPRDESKGEDKLKPPPKPEKKDEKNPQLDALLAALKGAKKKGGTDKNSNSNDKNKKGGESEFSLPDPVDPEPKADKEDKDDSLLGKNEEPEEGPNKADLLEALKNAKAAAPVEKSPLPPIAGGPFGGGGPPPFGGFGGGGGEMGPNIIGSASAPAGGSFDGDPFSGVGAVGYGGGGGKFNLAKKVEYGSGGGSVEGGDAEEGNGGDYLDGAISKLRSSVDRRMSQLQLIPTTKTGEKVMLLDYIGRLKETLCEDDERRALVEVCKKAYAKEYEKGLERIR